MQVRQSIEQPHGITVFGSYTLRVTPDTALLHLRVNRTASEPTQAFLDARDAVHAIREFLAPEELPPEDVQTSRATLQTVYRHFQGTTELIGYRAVVEFHVALTDLPRVEAVLAGMVEAGADEVRSVHYHTRRLRELRTHARREAMRSARKKAEVYCDAAGVTLGRVTHIEDLDPDSLTAPSRRGHGVDEDLLDGFEDVPQAYDPGAIRVAAAVMVSFALV